MSAFTQNPVTHSWRISTAFPILEHLGTNLRWLHRDSSRLVHTVETQMAGLQKHRIWLILAAVAAVFAVAIVLFCPEPDSGMEDSALEGAQSATGLKADWHLADEDPSASAENTTIDPSTDDPTNPAANTPERTLLRASVVPFRGRVTDAETGRPVTSFTVLLEKVSRRSRDDALHEKVDDEDGRYRTGPAQPGKIILNAFDLDRNNGETRRFTSEEKQSEIVDCDVQVDFGPLPGHLNWSGTLFGADGGPLAETRIELVRAKAPARGPGAKTLGRARTDDAGRFEFRKIFPETFRALVYLSAERRTVSGGDFEFEEPGCVERDIRLTCTGGTVSGVVIDETTGLPLTGSLSALSGGSVSAFPNNEYERQKFAEVSKLDGTFCFFSLPAGTYTLSCAFADRIRGLEVADGARIEGLELIVRPTGELRLRLEGFSADESAALDVNVCTESGPDRNIIWAGGQGPMRLTQRLKVGDYLLRYSIEEVGEGHGRFVISSGCTTDLTIRRDEMLPHALHLEVRGRMTLPGGEHAAGAALTFEQTKRHSQQRITRKTTCDAEGVFVLGDLSSGLWKVSCSAQGFTFRVNNVVIPPGATSPFTIDLAAPAGCVCGTLIDGATGGLVDTGDIDWLVRATRLGSVVWPADLRRPGKGRFRLQGVPEGRYTISAWVPGYEHFRSSLFEIGEGRTVDLGNLTLTPSGYLDLEVVERSGMAVNRPFVYCNGKRLGQIVEDNRHLSPNRRLFFNIPTGKVLIRVEPSGCVPAEKEVVLPPGVRTRLRIEVSRR